MNIVCVRFLRGNVADRLIYNVIHIMNITIYLYLLNSRLHSLPLITFSTKRNINDYRMSMY